MLSLPFLQCGKWSRWDYGLRVRRHYCKSGLSQPTSAEVFPFAAHACGRNSEAAQSLASSFRKGFQTCSVPIHADHPLPCCCFFSLLLTRLLSDSIPQATAFFSLLISLKPHPLPPRAALFHPRSPLLPPTIPSPTSIFDPSPSRIFRSLKRSLRFPFVPHGTISGLC